MNWKVFWYRIKYNVLMHKEGILIGAVVGFLSALFLASRGIMDFSTLVEGSKGLMDSLMARNSLAEVATYKFYVGLTLFGAFIGYVCDILFMYMGVGRKKR